MLAEADRTKPAPASLFVLLNVARDVAIQAGDAELALQAADRIAAAFDVDAAAMEEETLQKVATAARLSSQFKTLAEQAVPRIEAAAGRQDYQRALRLAELGVAAARRAREYLLAKQISDRLDALNESASAYAEVEKARAVLAEDPTDPEANLVVGRHLSFVQEDWSRGVAMLALGSDESLKSVAAAELKGADSAEAQVALADHWWDLAQSSSGDQRDAMLRHAGSWYQKARPEVSGLVLVKVDKRLAEIAKTAAPPAAAPSTRRGFPEGAVLLLTFEQDTFFEENGQTKVRDLSGHGNHGTVHGTKKGPGKAGQGLAFAAAGDYVDCGKDKSLAPADAMTVSAWIIGRRWNVAKSTIHNDIVGKDEWINRVSKGFTLRTNDKGQPDFNLGDGDWKQAQSAEQMRPGQWYHLTGRFDGKSVSLFVNGAIVARSAADKPIRPASTSLSIGRAAFDTERRFDGIVDEVAMFNRALSDDEIMDLFHMGVRAQPLAR
jgi:hypothetical protein